MRGLLAVALLSTGCFAAAGPTVGLVVPEGRPTIGWEASPSMLSVGQSFSADRWRRRTYLVFEPRLGRAFESSEDTFAGGGASIGWRWDVAHDPGGAPDRDWIGGAFAGGGRIIGGSGTSGDPTPYFSISLGVRGDEIYLAPKLGFFIPPDLNINLSVR